MNTLREHELAYIAAMEKLQAALDEKDAMDKRYNDEFNAMMREIQSLRLSVDLARSSLQTWIRLETEE